MQVDTSIFHESVTTGNALEKNIYYSLHSINSREAIKIELDK